MSTVTIRLQKETVQRLSKYAAFHDTYDTAVQKVLDKVEGRGAERKNC